MEIESSSLEEMPRQCQNNAQRSLQDNAREQSFDPSQYEVINIERQTADKNQASKRKEKIVKATQASFNFSKEEIKESYGFGHDEIKAQVLTQGAIDNIMMENERLKNEVGQLKKKLNAVAGASSSSSQGTQEEETKKNPEQESFNRHKLLNQSLEAKITQKKEKLSESRSIDQLKFHWQKKVSESYQKKVNELSEEIIISNRHIKKIESFKKQLTQQNQKMQKKLEKLTQFSEGIQYENSQVNQAVSNYKADQTFLQNKLTYYYQYVSKNEQDIQNLRRENNRLAKEIQAQKKNSASINQKKISAIINQKQKVIDDNKKQVDQLKSLNSTLQAKISTLEASQCKLKQQVDNLKRQNQNSQLQCEHSKQSIKKLTKQSEDLRRQVGDLNKQNKKVQEEVQRCKQQLAKQRKQRDAQKLKNQTEIKSLISQKQALRKEKDSERLKLNAEKQTLKKQIQDVKKLLKKQKQDREAEKNKLQRYINDLKTINSSLLKQSDQLKKARANLQADLAKKKQQIQQLVLNLKDYKQVLNPIMEVSGLNLNAGKNQIYPRFLRGSYFPDSFILGKQSFKKSQFLCQQLKKFIKVPSFSTQLIFKFDPINPQNNFFKYILGKKHIMVLVKLINGTVLGGFSEFPFEQQPRRPGNGFIFSLTAQKTFKMKNQPRVGVYTPDTYFIIIGSSELRLKYTEKKFFSNFGVSNGTFEANGFTKQQFLGIQEPNISEVQFQTYEIYTIDASQE